MTFLLISILSVGVGAWFAWATRQAGFFSMGGDNQKQVYAAAQLKISTWPSKMHQYAGGKARMKDVGVMSLALMQRFLKDRTSVYPLITLCNVAVSVSAILIYYIASTYWNSHIGLLVFVLFLFCFWPHQISLMGGFHCLAQVFLLISVMLFQISEWAPFSWRLVCYGLAGVAGCMIIFTSASGRKFLPLFVGAFLYSQCNAIIPLGFTPESWGSLFDGFGFFLLCLFFTILAGVMLVLLGIALLYRPIVTMAYKKSGPSWLNLIIRSRDKHSLERYLGLRGSIFSFALRWSLKIIFFLLVSIVLSRASSFYVAQLLVIAGVSVVVFLLTYPNVAENLREYAAYHYTTYKFSRFDEYTDYFRRIGRPIPKDKRGAGFSWIIRFFPDILPFHTTYFSIALLLSLYVFFFHNLKAEFFWKTLAVIGLSLSPIIYGEWTKAPQSSRAYFPALIGFLLLIAYSCFQFEKILAPENRAIFWIMAAGAGLLSTGWNVWIFFSDVFPARMLVSKFIQTSKRLGIKKIRTYDTKFNDVLVNFIKAEIGAEYQVEFIKSLKEVEKGYVIVPGISSKSWNFESYECGIKGQDFGEDPLLSKLIDTREINHFAVASLKTFGTSKIWINESEITTYRNYIVKDIEELDRWRSRTWILDGGRLHSYLMEMGAL